MYYEKIKIFIISNNPSITFRVKTKTNLQNLKLRTNSKQKTVLGDLRRFSISTHILGKWLSKIRLAAIFLTILPVFYTGSFASQSYSNKITSSEQYLTHAACKLTCIFDGQIRTFVSQAPTIREAIKEAEIEFGPNDVTEPELDTILTSQPLAFRILRAKPVVVYDSEKEIKGFSGYSDFPRILNQMGIQVYPEDILEDAADPVHDIVLGSKIRIKRAMPINLYLDGKKEVTRTWAKTVSDLLSEKGIKLSRKDKVKPSLDTQISANLKIRVIRTTVKIIKRTVKVAPPITYINDSNLAVGKTKVIKQGTSGKERQTLRIKYENGKIVQKKVLAKKTISKPTPKIVRRGTKLVYEGWVTWYGPGFHGRGTASGERFNMYDLTAAHKWLPFGTRVKITNPQNGKSAIVRINDRGPFSYHIFDLSYAAKQKIGMASVAYVKYEIL